MERAALDIYDDMPRYMKRYISNYGWHFNKAAYEYAIKHLKDKNGNKAIPYPKDRLDTLLDTYSIKNESNVMYDYMFIAAFYKAKYYNSAIKDDRSLVMFIKDTIDNGDSSKGLIFRMWLSAMIANGNPIDWEELC